uniref:Synaptobrevin, longin-like domain protein n=1 Tax=Tanacetum cinerariifolium TaxID=118510 RepID=A0A6L2K0G0_TANCI|nr:hypothetical protein [Tanacetum cinerariifolium]
MSLSLTCLSPSLSRATTTTAATLTAASLSATPYCHTPPPHCHNPTDVTTTPSPPEPPLHHYTPRCRYHHIILGGVVRLLLLPPKPPPYGGVRFRDERGIACLPNEAIFEQLTLMGAKKTAWNEFSSTIASAIICLATNQQFNFSKYIFESMVKNPDSPTNFLMFPRFIQVFLNNQLEEMANHTRIYVPPSHSKKIFGNMKRRKQKPKRPRRKDTELPQTSVPIEVVADEVVFEEMYDSVERATIISIGLDAEHDRVIIKSSVKDESLGKEDASKQERISDIEANQDIYLVNVHIDEDIFGVNDQDDTSMFDADKDLYGEEVVVEKVDAASIATTAAAIIAVSINDITLAQALVEIKISKPKAIGIILQEPSETSTTTTKPISSKVQEKGKAARLQEEEQGELTIEEKSRLFVELMDKRKKDFVKLRAEEQRRKPPYKAQKRNQMCAYLKNMAGFTHNQLKNRSFDEVQKAFDKSMSWINAFVPMDSEVVKDKARVEEENDFAKLKRCLEIVPDDGDDVTIEATPLSSKSPTIVDYKIYKEGRKNLFLNHQSRRIISSLKEDYWDIKAKYFIDAVQDYYCYWSSSWKRLSELMLSELKLLTGYVQDVYGKD